MLGSSRRQYYHCGLLRDPLNVLTGSIQPKIKGGSSSSAGYNPTLHLYAGSTAHAYAVQQGTGRIGKIPAILWRAQRKLPKGIPKLALFQK